MPPRGDQEKTEQPTARRRQKAREKGQVAKGREVAAVAVLLVSLVVFYMAGKGMLSRTLVLWSDFLSTAARPALTDESTIRLLGSVMVSMGHILLPLWTAVVLGAVLANVLQVGFLLSAKGITPDLNRIDPIKGFQRLFSLKSLVELIKSLGKLAAVGIVVYLTIRSEMPLAFPLMQGDGWAVLTFILNTAFTILYRTAWVLLVLAVLDYAYQRWEFERDLKMTKQEVKDEFKQSEGDPLVKSRIRALQREMARRRMMEEVPKADVVITNPTELAVALRYERGMRAPLVVAKGAGFIAETIRKVARMHGVPIVENRAVAQLLFKMADIGQEIPSSVYKAVAEILAYVYRIKKKSVL